MRKDAASISKNGAFVLHALNRRAGEDRFNKHRWGQVAMSGNVVDDADRRYIDLATMRHEHVVREGWSVELTKAAGMTACRNDGLPRRVA